MKDDSSTSALIAILHPSSGRLIERQRQEFRHVKLFASSQTSPRPDRLHDLFGRRLGFERPSRVTADAIGTLRRVRHGDGDKLLTFAPSAPSANVWRPNP